MCYFIIRDVSLVGMQYWGDHSLPLEKGYVLSGEPENPVDPNAVAVRERATALKRDYFSRNWTKKQQPILLHNPSIVNLALLKIKTPVRVAKYWQVPEHGCTLGFSCNDINKTVLEQILESQSISFTCEKSKSGSQ